MKKRILVLNYEFPPLGGGASPVSYDISKEYVKNGYDVDVVTMGFGGLPSFEIVEGINIHRVRCLRTKKAVCHPWEQATYLYFGYKKAKELVQKYVYEICHCHFIIPTGVIAQRLKKNFGLEYIITAHGSDVLGHNDRFTFLYKVLEKSRKNIIKNAKYVISPSHYLKGGIEKYYGKSDKVVVIPNGIEKDKFIPMKKEKYILTVSRLQKSKGIQDLIEAIRDIDLGDWRLKIVGTGPYEESLKKLVKSYHLEEKVDFVGRVDNKSQKMRDLYGRASVFCQPSYFENASIVLLEAMQAGCCILAREVGGNTESMSGDSLFATENEFRTKLGNIMNDNAMRNKIKDKLGEKKEEYFWGNLAERYMGLFDHE